MDASDGRRWLAAAEAGAIDGARGILIQHHRLASLKLTEVTRPPPSSRTRRMRTATSSSAACRTSAWATR